MADSTLERNRTDWKRILSKLFYSANDRAKRRGIVFTIELADMLALWEKQQGKCVMTGMPFILELPHSDPKENPWRPSMDRIDPLKGYEVGNIRLVVKIGNYARHNFPEKDLEYFCRRYLELNT